MASRPEAYVIKAAVADPTVPRFRFDAQKTMYGGKQVQTDDRIFVFASETNGGSGLIARGRVTDSTALPRTEAVRQTPRVSLEIAVSDPALRPLGRECLKPFRGEAGRSPQGELDFKLYRQATNKLVGISVEAAAFLDSFFLS
jgi:hypothetical protein